MPIASDVPSLNCPSAAMGTTPCRANAGTEMRMAAAAGERTLESDHMVCIMPLARGNCGSGTSMAYDVSNDDMWNAPKVEYNVERMSSIHSCSELVASSVTSTRLRQPLAKSIAIIVRLRSCRSAHAPASGAPNTAGNANASPLAASANASAGFCSGSG